MESDKAPHGADEHIYKDEKDIALLIKKKELDLKTQEVLSKYIENVKEITEFSHIKKINSFMETNYSLKNLALKLEILNTLYDININNINSSFDDLIKIIDGLGENSEIFIDLRAVHENRIRARRQAIFGMYN